MKSNCFNLSIIITMFLWFGLTSANAATINVTNIRTEHNVVKNDIKGMNIVLNFTISNCTKNFAVVDVYVYDASGNPIVAPNSSFDDVGNGYVSARHFLQPIYSTSYFNDYRIFIPYAALVNVGAGNYSLRATFFAAETEGCNLLSYKCSSATIFFAFNTNSQKPNQSNANPLQQLMSSLLNPTFKFDFSNLSPAPSIPVQTTTNTNVKQKERCLACNGTGRIEKHLYTSGGGFFFCSECGRERPNGHYHSNCSGCYGTGWLGGGL